MNGEGVKVASVSVSAFAADFSNMKRDIDLAQESDADYIHMDVMDGNFVPFIGLGTSWIEDMLQYIKIPIDVHLMTNKMEFFADQFIKYPINSLLLHVGVSNNVSIKDELLKIQSHAILCGVAISPDTHIEQISSYIPYLDEILVMGTMPGCKGTVFLENTYERIMQVRSLTSRNSNTIISVDGGVNETIALKCIASGADKIVMGRAFFDSQNPSALIRKIHKQQSC